MNVKADLPHFEMSMSKSHPRDFLGEEGGPIPFLLAFRPRRCADIVSTTVRGW